MSTQRNRPAAEVSGDEFARREALAEWRAFLVRRVVGVSAGVAVLPCLLVSWLAWQGGSWQAAVVEWLIVTALFYLAASQRVPHGWRAAVALALLFAAGLWLLAKGSAVSMLFLLACPVMCVIAVGLRAAMLALVACAASLVGVGWWLQLPIPVTAGPAGADLVRWLVAGSILFMLGLLLTLSCNYLLRRLQGALDAQCQAAVALQRSEELFRAVASQLPGVVFRAEVASRGILRFLYVSPGSRALLGLEPQALMADVGPLRQRVHAADLARMHGILPGLHAGEALHEVEFRYQRPDGQQRWLLLQNNGSEPQGELRITTGVISDITERKTAEAMVWQQANHDALTGLPNRLMLLRELDRMLAEARRQARPAALLMVDLDRFKEVNDKMGHAHGDQLLVMAAERLRQTVREGDLVGRMGGDEFMLLLPSLDGEAEAQAVGQRVLHTLGQAFELPGATVRVSASLGLALFPQDAEQADELLVQADQAMYQAKHSGRSRLCRFTSQLQAEAKRRLRLGDGLRHAIGAGQLSLVYQPIVELTTGRVCKAEALLRWQHPELGPISPAEFIPIAEATGLIVDIGEWVFHAAARQAAQWRRDIDPCFQVSINRSPLQFGADGPGLSNWPQQLAAMGLAGDAIVVEITEGLLLDNSEQVHRQLEGFRAAGMSVSLDDFGTGYSALAYLHRFKLDYLKIDRSFVSGEGSDLTGRTLCRAIVTMAHELGIRVVAEGVETAAQRDWLRSIGCDHAQGWLLGRPMTPQAFVQALQPEALHAGL